MPRPRFEKLPPEKQEAILETAAKSFAEQGYAGASLNQILSDAGVSKGAAYYYFDDKADLFATAVERYSPDMDLNVQALLAETTAANFWDVFARFYQSPFLSTFEKPWQLGIVKAAAQLPPDSPVRARLQPLFDQAFGWMDVVITRGQSLGVIRTDLPQEFMYMLISAVDAVGDNWIVAQLGQWSLADMTAMLDQIIDVMRGMLTPRQEKKR